MEGGRHFEWEANVCEWMLVGGRSNFWYSCCISFSITFLNTGVKTFERQIPTTNHLFSSAVSILKMPFLCR